jgi:hypothetical protein
VYRPNCPHEIAQQGERKLMRWFRSNTRSGVATALFVLLVQFAVTFSHVHLDGLILPLRPNYLALLNAQQTYQQALLSVVQAEAARYGDTVALVQALGGGWWNRADAKPEPPLSIVDIFR